MSESNIWVLGGFQTDFARNFQREGLDFAALSREVVTGALEAAAVAASDVEVIHVGNAFGQLFTAQGQLGAMPSTVCPDLWEVPASRHEAACASGSIAALAAMSDLRAGAYDSALVLGLELEKTVPGDDAAQTLGAAAWVGYEGQDAKFMWPYMFDKVAEEYDRRYGIRDEHLHAIAQLNFDNGRNNPNAQTRDWQVPNLRTADDATNPPVEGRVRRFDCSQITDGGAGVVLVNDQYLCEHPGAKPWGRIAGWGHKTVGLGLQQKLEHSSGHDYVLPHLRHAVEDAFKRAQVALDDLDGLETHDCFTPSEYVAIDHIGLTAPGESWKAIENGDIEKDGRLPINPSGGLIGGGHPVGASGVRMLLDAAKQVRGIAGDYQIEGAQTFATLNFGGSTATTVSLIVDQVHQG
ncbi:acetyl-CoA acetyltransferase [Sciscionella marina]|uniref:acetyl-CoA acetyltransferase n=1 Tax=Sciscionella marina TaxID=508770 RepID=UPI000368CDA3|nr:acetyl-CoA acetyltransferase [Sciscionella marina]